MKFVWPAVFCVLILRSYAQSYFHEPCPPDSIEIENVCHCDYSLCETPPCETTLVQITNDTDVPGSCCPTYSCEGCEKEEEIEGMCPCLPGAILRNGRKCECAHYHQTLINGTCECDVNKCKLPNLCDKGSVAVKESDGCCERIDCKQCPEDSYATSYSDLSLEDKCVCYQCPITKCNDTQSLRILRKGRNIPRMCCDIYSCENGCLVNGTVYPEGETWRSDDTSCKCQDGLSRCWPLNGNESFRACLSGEKIYHHLETWMEDSCTNCTCNNGTPKCIAHLCGVHVSELKPQPIECPSMTACTKVCENGFKLSKQGCEICKCKNDKVVMQKLSKLDKLLLDYNLTEDDLVGMIKSCVKEESASKILSTTSTSTAPSTTVCITQNKSVTGDCAYSCILEYGVPGFVVGAIFSGVLLFTFLKCFEKNRQQYKMHYNYKPVGKEGLDRNLNISPIINSELKSYNEKKNVI